MKLFTFVIALFSLNLFAQGLPFESRITEDGRQIITGDKQVTGIYDDRVVREMRIYFTEPNYWSILTSNYQSKTNLKAKMIYEGKTYEGIGVRFKGQTSYGVVFGGPGSTSQKKSFNISMDFTVDDQNIEGYKTFNLNNSFQDPSFMKEVVYYTLIRRHSTASKASFIRLFINDQDWGIYQNIQQLNKDFLEEWWPNNDGSNWRADIPPGNPSGGTGIGWGDGKAAINYLGDDISTYQKNYTLKSTGSSNPWQELVTACRILNQTPISDLEAVGKDYFDWDKIIWHLASEVLFCDDDSYVYKGKMDYYLYKDEVTGRISTFDYDGNSTLNNNFLGWSPFYNEEKVNYPLMNRILQVPKLRQRYISHLKVLIDQYCDNSKIESKLNAYKALIEKFVEADPKKATSYTAFLNGIGPLKTFLEKRKIAILNNLEFRSARPTIQETKFTTKADWIPPIEGENVVISTKATHSAGINAVILYYAIGLYNPFLSIAMNDLGENGDLKANDGIFSATITGQKSQTFVKYYIEAIANDSQKTSAYFPEGAEHDIMIYQVQGQVSSNKDVVINEFMSLNTTGPTDENNQNEDWVELYNITDKDIDISGYHLSDNLLNYKKWQFPVNTKIKAKSYLIVWCDEDKTEGPYHASFKLAGAGETIILSDKEGKLIDSISYSAVPQNKSFSRIPNGTGSFKITDHTHGMNNNTTVGLEEELPLSIKFYPNPFTSFVKIKTNKPIDLNISTLSGIKMKDIKIENETIIDMSDFPSGIYIAKGINSPIQYKLVKY
jgi:spore coat protein CotH